MPKMPVLQRDIVPFIENVSLDNACKAWHFDPGPNSLLIRIIDPDMEFGQVKYPFKETAKFKFLDIEDDDVGDKITELDAQCIVRRLIHARNNHMNVIVHCVAGVCRSGAVAEFAIAALGFQDTERYRQPNLRVKRMLFEAFERIKSEV